MMVGSLKLAPLARTSRNWCVGNFIEAVMLVRSPHLDRRGVHTLAARRMTPTTRPHDDVRTTSL